MQTGKNSRERQMVHLIALLTASMGVVNLISAVQPALLDRLAIIERIFSFEFLHGSRITSALAGFALMLVATNLWRRKRSAWSLTVVLLVISIFTHLFKGLDFEEASLSLGVLILLILFRHSFHAESDRPSIRQGLFILGAAFAFTLVYGSIGIFLLDGHFGTSYSLLAAIRQTVVLVFTFSNPGLEATSRFGRFFIGSIYTIGYSTFGFALLMLIRPVLIRNPATPEEREHAKKIVEDHGRTALARAALFDDKSYFFGPGDTVIAYATHGRGAMVLGDPIGPAAQVAEAIDAFQEYCTQKGWTPSFINTLPDFLDLYKKAGFDALCIGYEAIVLLENFSLIGSENKDIRYAVNRLKRNGYTSIVHTPPLQEDLIQSLREISNAWLTMKRGGEMHFSDGWFDEAYLRNGPVIVIYTPAGIPIAFANLVSEYQKNELTIDLMRHYLEVEYGTMEFLFAEMLLWAKENGYQTFSLGLSAIVGVGEKPDDPRIDQALHTISEYVSRFYNFKGLHHFKDKFHPGWEPRYLIYRGSGNLPLVLDTLLYVHSGKHFLWKFLKK